MTPKMLTEEELEALSVLVNQEIWDHFSAHIAALTERNAEMRDALWHLCNEATAEGDAARADRDAFDEELDTVEQERDAAVREAGELREKLLALQFAVSPSRIGMVNDDYFIGVVNRMRSREVVILPSAVDSGKVGE